VGGGSLGGIEDGSLSSFNRHLFRGIRASEPISRPPLYTLLL
jgi:hypothetical protein